MTRWPTSLDHSTYCIYSAKICDDILIFLFISNFPSNKYYLPDHQLQHLSGLASSGGELLLLVQHDVRPDCSLAEAVTDKHRGGATPASRPAQDPAVQSELESELESGISQLKEEIAFHANWKEKYGKFLSKFLGQKIAFLQSSTQFSIITKRFVSIPT